MFATIIRYFGWDGSQPTQPRKQAQLRSGPGALSPIRTETGTRGGVGALEAVAHAMPKAETEEAGVKPAMAVIPRDVDQRMPRRASPGLPPVDPVEQPAKRFAADAIARGDEGAASTVPDRVAAGRDSLDEAAPSSPGFDRSETGNARPTPDPTRPSSTSGFPDLRQDDAVRASESLEMVDQSIERSFADMVSAQGPSKDRRDDIEEWEKDLLDMADELLQLELFPGLAMRSEHSMDVGYDDGKAFQATGRKDCTQSFETADQSVEPRETGGHRLDVDLPIETGLPRVTTPARKFSKLPQRVADRPRSEEWNDDELLTLPEAAALFWPGGPITTNTLRTAGRDATLAITKVAGKFFTTPMAIRRMGLDGGNVRSSAGATAHETPASPQSVLEKKLAEARGPGRKRSRRGGAGS